MNKIMLSKELEKIAKKINAKEVDKEWLKMINSYIKGLSKISDHLYKKDNEIRKIWKELEEYGSKLNKAEKIPSPAATYMHESIEKIIDIAWELKVANGDINVQAVTLRNSIKEFEKVIKKNN